MTIGRRILALALTLVIVAGMLPESVYAFNTTGGTVKAVVSKDCDCDDCAHDDCDCEDHFGESHSCSCDDCYDHAASYKFAAAETESESEPIPEPDAEPGSTNCKHESSAR